MSHSSDFGSDDWKAGKSRAAKAAMAGAQSKLGEVDMDCFEDECTPDKE